MPWDGREYLPILLQQLKYKGSSAEVGVWMGNHTAKLVGRWPLGGSHLAVDPYESVPCTSNKEKDKQCLSSQLKMDAVFEGTRSWLRSKFESRFPGRINLARNYSAEAARSLVAQQSLDFVYIDALHEYKPVAQDLRVWWPKVCAGGIFAGHDISWKGVEQAVVEFVREHAHEVHHVFITGDHVPSWFFFKRPSVCTR